MAQLVEEQAKVRKQLAEIHALVDISRGRAAPETEAEDKASPQPAADSGVASPPPAALPPASSGEAPLDAMMKRLEDLEKILREDT